MFSANENILLRQQKRRIVEYVEATIPESVLDQGVNVMVMQVNCTAPGCVPIETCIIIVFPKSSIELIPGLPESAGGSFKTKVLKPMADVTNDDVLYVLPPVGFIGGKRPTTSELCLQLRDVVLGQITQVFGDMDVIGRTMVAQYLQSSLSDYIANNCEPPPLGQPFPSSSSSTVVQSDAATGIEPIATLASATSADSNTVPSAPSVVAATIESSTTTTAEQQSRLLHGGTGNIVLTRPVDQEENASSKVISRSNPPPTAVVSLVNSTTQKRQQQNATKTILQQTSSGTLLAQLSQREHLPGIRRPGCPCCDPDNLSTVVDTLLSQI